MQELVPAARRAPDPILLSVREAACLDDRLTRTPVSRTTSKPSFVEFVFRKLAPAKLVSLLRVPL